MRHYGWLLSIVKCSASLLKAIIHVGAASLYLCPAVEQLLAISSVLAAFRNRHKLVKSRDGYQTGLLIAMDFCIQFVILVLGALQ